MGNKIKMCNLYIYLIFMFLFLFNSSGIYAEASQVQIKDPPELTYAQVNKHDWLAHEYIMAIDKNDVARVRELATGYFVVPGGGRISFSVDTATGGRTPLMYAIEHGNIEIIDVLIQAGASLDERDFDGNSPFMYVFDHYRGKPINIEVLKYLLALQPRINAQNSKYMTPLMAAASVIDPCESIRLLTEAGANPEIRDKAGRTSLFQAANKSKEATVQCLIEHGADVNTQDGLGITPLMDAAMRDDLEMIKILLAAGANLDIISKPIKIRRIEFPNGATVFDFARNYPDIEETLLDYANGKR